MKSDLSGQGGVTLSPEPETNCPTCGLRCYQGIRGRGALIGFCPDCGVFATVGRTRPDVGQGTMDPEERLWLIETALTRFLVDPDQDDFLIAASVWRGCNYVEFRTVGRRLWAEVSCREWDCALCGNQPLPAAAVAELRATGFSDGGGPHCNFHTGTLEPNPTALARLADDAMLRAFDEKGDYEVGIYLKRTDTFRDLVAAVGRGPRHGMDLQLGR